MAQAQKGEKMQETLEMEMKPIATSMVATSSSSSSSSSAFKFNAQAPEFVPRSYAQVPISGYFYPCFQFLGDSATAAGSGSDWIYVGDQESAYFISNPSVPVTDCSKNVLTDDLRQKIVKQVEYQFSDLSLLANESLVKQINKDPEGYEKVTRSSGSTPIGEVPPDRVTFIKVPIAVIASTKKIKSLLTNNHLITQALRSSPKLIISTDGKKVKRRYPFTEKDKEDLQSRTVVAENLPEDHSHQNLEKIFAVVGSVKSIRICHPQEPNSSRSNKSDYVISNKLHALVEYETTEVAEKAVEKLNDERNWRKGLRVRLLLRRSPKSVLKSRKSDFDGLLDDDEFPESMEESSQPNSAPSVLESHTEENSTSLKKGWGRAGRGKSRVRVQNHGGRGLLASSPHPQSSSCGIQCETSPKQNAKGPRMPDGTRGFTMGRGKSLTASPHE